MTKRLLVVVTSILLFGQTIPVSGEPVCHDGRPNDGFPVRETNLEVDGAMSRVEWLGGLGRPFDELIEKSSHGEAADAKQVLEPAQLNPESFWIHYSNSLMDIRGTILRQRALLTRSELVLAKLQRNRRATELARVAFDVARREFCQYLSQAYYND